MSAPKLLVVGDGSGITGFSRVIRSILEPLSSRYQIHHLAVGYFGDPHDYPWPLPKDVKEAIDHYLKLDRKRRELVHSDQYDTFLFQPRSIYRTLQFDKGLSSRMVHNIVRRWASYGGIGEASPHDLRRTAITRALESGLIYRQVQMMSKHKDPKTVMRYDHGRENLGQNAVNFLKYEEE